MWAAQNAQPARGERPPWAFPSLFTGGMEIVHQPRQMATRRSVKRASLFLFKVFLYRLGYT